MRKAALAARSDQECELAAFLRTTDVRPRPGRSHSGPRPEEVPVLARPQDELDPARGGSTQDHAPRGARFSPCWRWACSRVRPEAMWSYCPPCP